MSQVKPGDRSLSNYAGQGDPEKWDNIWRSVDVDRRQLYTEDPFRNTAQLAFRGYFEDLWYYMGETAHSARYLEVGAGRGTTAMYLSKQECDVTMLDLSANGFRIAEANFKRHGIKLPAMLIADAQNTGLPDCSFDCVYSIGVLEHFVDPVPLLREAFRLLKPDGLLFKIIAPSKGAIDGWPLRCLLNPLDLSLRMAKHTVKQLIRYIPPEQNNLRTTRTNYPRSRYKQWMCELGAVGVICIPYNPYREVYRRKVLNEKIALPVYRHHYLRKKAARNYPLLATYPSIAICDLLVCRKGRP